MVSTWYYSSLLRTAVTGTLLLLLQPLFISTGIEGSRILLDASGVREYENQLKLYTYNALSDLDHLATNTFRLKLNPKSFQKLNFLQNITKAGVSFNGLTDFPDYSTISKEAYKKLGANLSEESLFLLKALSSKNLKIPLALQPSDEHIPDAISFMDTFKEYWKQVDRVAPVEIEKLNAEDIPAKVKEILEKRSYKTSNRIDRKFLVPELPLQVSEDYIKHLLTNVFIKPRDHGSEESVFEKEVIRAFVTRSFEEIGLYVYNHEFSAHENHYLFGQQIVGTNVVGFLPGELWGTAKDKPLIVGAHYDTVSNTTGTVDNASGMSAVLEIARMLSSSNCKFKNSIFFVAFDLEEIGAQGSFMFVKDFLLKLLFPSYGIKSIGGAFILDCIGNWDANNDTQAIPDPWEEKVHGLKAKIESRSSTGDFMAVMYREKPDYVLAERLQYYYDGLGAPEYRAELMALKELKESRPNDSVNIENYDFFRSDHYRFWYPSEEAPNISLSALLITDTGPYRGKMAKCYHGACDTLEYIKPSIAFIAKITRATAWAIADLASATCGPNGVFRVPEMFLLTKERQVLEQKEPERSKRPVVTLEGVIQILRYLGRVNLQTFEESLGDIDATSSSTDHSAVTRTPVHRFSIRQKGSEELSNINKVTITIHGKNSSYLIPLRVAYPLTQKPNSELKGYFTLRRTNNTGENVPRGTGKVGMHVSKITGVNVPKITGKAGINVPKITGKTGINVPEITGKTGINVAEITGINVPKITGKTDINVPERTGKTGVNVHEITGKPGINLPKSTGINVPKTYSNVGINVSKKTGTYVREITGKTRKNVPEKSGINVPELTGKTGINVSKITSNIGINVPKRNIGINVSKRTGINVPEITGITRKIVPERSAKSSTDSLASKISKIYDVR